MPKQLYEKVEVEDGVGVQYLGVYALHWQRAWGKPEVGFVEHDYDALLVAEHAAAQSDDCMLPKVDMCCCDCIHHLADMSHPETDGGSFMQRRGWICAAPDFLVEGRAFSGWVAHGLCEAHASRMLDPADLGGWSSDKLARGLLAAIGEKNGESGETGTDED